MVSPVHVGEEYDVVIETVGSKGDGVAKIKGYVVFIPKVSEGAKLRIRVTQTLDKVGFGEVVVAASKESEEENDEQEEKKDIAREQSDIIPEEKGADVPDSEDESEEKAEPVAESDDEEVPEA